MKFSQQERRAAKCNSRQSEMLAEWDHCSQFEGASRRMEKCLQMTCKVDKIVRKCFQKWSLQGMNFFLRIVQSISSKTRFCEHWLLQKCTFWTLSGFFFMLSKSCTGCALSSKNWAQLFDCFLQKVSDELWRPQQWQSKISEFCFETPSVLCKTMVCVVSHCSAEPASLEAVNVSVCTPCCHHQWQCVADLSSLSWSLSQLKGGCFCRMNIQPSC